MGFVLHVKFRIYQVFSGVNVKFKFYQVFSGVLIKFKFYQVFSGVHVTRSSCFCVMCCRSLSICPFSLAIVIVCPSINGF